MSELSVTLENEGQKFVGVLHKPNSPTKKAVILVHGFTGNKNGPDDIFVKLAKKLVENGIAAFRFDFRGSGESEGRFVDMTITGEVSDLQKAVEFMAKNYDLLGVVGESLGGAVSIIGYDVQFDCMVLWYPVVYLQETPSFKAMAERKEELETKGSIFVKEKDGWSYNVGKNFFHERTKIDVAKYVRSIKCPLLIITGNNDNSVPHNQSERAMELASSKSKKLELIDGADHCFRGRRAKEWQQLAINLTVDWFNKWLK